LGRFCQARDQRDIRQSWREQAVRSGFSVSACSLERLTDHSIVMLLGWSLKKDVCPGIHEEADARCIGRLSSAPDAIGLIGDLAEFSIRGEAVFQIAAHSSRANRDVDGFTDCFRRVAITALQINRYRQIRGADNPPQIINRQREGKMLAISETVCIGHRPTTRRDGLGACLADMAGQRVAWHGYVKVQAGQGAGVAGYCVGAGLIRWQTFLRYISFLF
jgi:hypothetical protein